VLEKEGAVEHLSESFKDEHWVLVRNFCGFFASVYRIRPGYELPEEAKPELKVFWGERDENYLSPSYEMPNGLVHPYQRCAGWAKKNGWYFMGFCPDKKDNTIPYILPWYSGQEVMKNNQSCFEICKFAKFVKKQPAAD